MLSYLKKITLFIISRVQKILLPVFLFILYTAGFGCTLFFLMIFNRKALSRVYEGSGTYWHKALGYGPDDENSRQA